MGLREQTAIDGLRSERERLLALKKSDLTYKVFEKWLADGQAVFLRGEAILGANSIRNPINSNISGYRDVSDHEQLDAVRDWLVGHLDRSIQSIDEKAPVVSVLEALVAKVADTKLATLLNEFNSAKDRQPNIAAIAFRTILSLVIRERAKLCDPGSTLATKEDLALEKDINMALTAKIFSEGETKRLKRFLGGGNKDTCDIVAHKAGDRALVNKDDLADDVDLLNKLLATIT